VLTAATLSAPLVAVAAPLAGLCLGPSLAGVTASHPMLSLAVAAAVAAAAASAVSLARVRGQKAGQSSRTARPPAEQPESPG
jgi:hypothetical protein